MPKFITYQRPAPVTRQNWNKTPPRPVRPAPAAPQPGPAGNGVTLPRLAEILRKS